MATIKDGPVTTKIGNDMEIEVEVKPSAVSVSEADEIIARQDRNNSEWLAMESDRRDKTIRMVRGELERITLIIDQWLPQDIKVDGQRVMLNITLYCDEQRMSDGPDLDVDIVSAARAAQELASILE